MGQKRSRQELNSDITPLIDVVFLLLIFFMVATVFKTDELALLLNLPKVDKSLAKSQTPPQSKTIEVSADEVVFNGKKIGLELLEKELQAIADKNTSIEMRVDKEVKYDRVMQVLSKLKKYELTNLALITEQ